METCEGRVTPNFHRASLALPGGAVDVLCYSCLPLVAVVLPTAGGDSMSLRFVDVPQLAEAMRAAGPFRALASAELDAPGPAGAVTTSTEVVTPSAEPAS